MTDHSVTQAVATFQRQLHAFNSHNLDAFVAAYHPESLVERDGGVILSGREEIAASYQTRFQDNALRCDVLSMSCPTAGWVVAHERIASSAGTVEVIALFECADSMVSRAIIYSHTVVQREQESGV